MSEVLNRLALRLERNIIAAEQSAEAYRAGNDYPAVDTSAWADSYALDAKHMREELDAIGALISGGGTSAEPPGA